MRQIRKLHPPASLIQFRATVRATPGRSYEDYEDKQPLREQLVREQRGLCCYCLCRIQADAGVMKIEHWHSQDSFPKEALDYSNLLGACKGNEGSPPGSQHCDTRKGKAIIKWNPANPDHRIEERIRYILTDGTVMSDDAEFDEQLNSVLNLNARFLKNNRFAVLNSFQQSLGRKPLSRVEWQRKLRDLNGETHGGEIDEYCQIVVYYIRKKLARA